jgi:hypothetical protein
MKKYRIMQHGSASFSVECFMPNIWGLFWKWRSLKRPVGMMVMTVYFPTIEDAERYAAEDQEFSGGPKQVKEVS